VIHYAQTARQSTLKLLALLRWKSTIDVGAGLLALPSNHPDAVPVFPNGFGVPNGVEQTPSLAELNKGRLRDVSRVTTLMEYYADHFKQNVLHLENVRRQVDSLR
jgi:mediator of RNA polymerase II transcription subunit 14